MKELTPKRAMVYCFDIDGTLCSNTEGDYERAEPERSNIDRVNSLYQAGHRILLYTARGATTGIDWRALTENQLDRWGVRYHQLYMGKPTADIYIDDKAVNVRDWFTPQQSSDNGFNHVNASDQTNTPDQVNAPKPDYLELTYSEQRLPPSDYPSLLTKWLATNVFPKPGRLLDVGCGRGEYLETFARLGFEVVGIDSAPSAQGMAAGLEVKVANIEEGLPFPNESFDYIYSKSNIEHLQQPGRMLRECYRVLRPGGVAAIMAPSWRHQWRVFYEDYTHVSPFTVNGLRDALTLAGFSDVEVKLFWQLPFLWKRPWLFPFTRVVAFMPLRYRPWDRAPWPESVNKLIRFSKEAMLLGLAKKDS